MSEDKEVMNADEVAAYLGVSKRCVYGWVSRRRMPFLKIGRLTRFRRSDLDRWLHKQAVKEMA